MDMDREIRVLLPYASDKKSGRLGFKDSGHVFDAKDMCSHRHDFVNEIQVVLQIVFLLWVQHVATVTNCSFDDTASLLDSLHTNFELVEVIQSIKDTENVNTIDFGLLAKVVNGVVGKTRDFGQCPEKTRRIGLDSRGICNTICATKQHLERNVWN
jgi:hypothetical protein